LCVADCAMEREEIPANKIKVSKKRFVIIGDIRFLQTYAVNLGLHVFVRFVVQRNYKN
jgi:hypothetical protein